MSEATASKRVILVDACSMEQMEAAEAKMRALMEACERERQPGQRLAFSWTPHPEVSSDTDANPNPAPCG